MAIGTQEVDLKQLVLYGGAFGPVEIEMLKKAISRDSKKFEELKSAVNELKTKDEEELSPASRVRLGVCQVLIGQFDEAFASLKKGDGGALVHFYFAKLYVGKGRYAEAIDCYNTAQSAGYNVDDCTLGRAEAYREMGKVKQSLQELDTLSGAVEQTAEYLYQRGATVNAIGGNPQEAIALFERAVGADPTHPGALYGLALENERRGNDEEALELYKRAASNFPTNVGTLINLGILYEDMEKYELALNCFQRVLDAYPTNNRARLYVKDAKAALSMVSDSGSEEIETQRNRMLAQPISNFELSQRSRNCLAAMDIETLGDLCKHTERELLEMPNFGETSLNEIKKLLQAKGLDLGADSVAKSVSTPVNTADLAPEVRAKLDLPVTDLDLSVRARKCMNRLGIKTIEELVSKSADELLSCKNFGVTSLKEINEKLALHNLKLKGE